MEKGKPVEIDQEALAAMLADIPAVAESSARRFTATEDAFILAVWERKLNKPVAAKKLGICEGTMRKRYSELKEKNK